MAAPDASAARPRQGAAGAVYMSAADASPGFFDCGIPGHPVGYAHGHGGGWRDCATCQGDLEAALSGGMAGLVDGFVTAHLGVATVPLDDVLAFRHSDHSAPGGR